jgi:hypothetical protein
MRFLREVVLVMRAASAQGFKNALLRRDPYGLDASLATAMLKVKVS